ncbi:S8 family serine peptidase [Fibrella aquatica]|uniref:S8 family serine peptidase n=1 Tax=Fibrella aquatica TaxID=3242487 RepID=UPI003520E7C2
MPIFYRLLGLFLLLAGSAFAQPLPQYNLAQKKQLQLLQQTVTLEQAVNYQEAVTVALKQGRKVEEPAGDGLVRRLRGIDEQTGNLLYDMVDFNARAANTTRTNSLYAGGSLGVNLTGSSEAVRNRLGIWDGGRVYAAHPELVNRVIQQDTPSNTGREDEDVYHASHVAGTMVATGINQLARGMASGANLKAWDFSDDISEMTLAANELLVSNHSYGTIAGWRFNSSRTTTNKWEWWGDTTLSATQDFKFGLYETNARSWDRLANASPYYLIVKSAGNFHAEGGPPAGQGYYLVQHGNRVSTTPRDTQFGYDQISTYGTAKNILTVGAMSAISSGYKRASDVNLGTFSSWGPTDDGRIKPDILGVGVNVISTSSSADFAYGSLSGTSMSSPNVSGSVLLLQEYFAQLNPGRLMRAATLKGLVIHTADEAGTTTGPDYQAGWGLLNMERAARVIQNADKSHLLDERTLTQGQSYSVAVVASGLGPLVATICWSDPEGAATTGTDRFNNRTPKLVNDLDARLSDGSTTLLPWTLDPENPAQAARPGDNIRDNVEQVYVANPVPGRTYTLTISHKGTLTGAGGQAYALLVSGAGGTAYCASAATSSADSKITRVQFAGVNQAGSETCATYTDFMSTTAAVTDVQPNQPIPLTVTTGTCGAVKPVVVKVYADWNANGTFTDAGELLGTSAVLPGPGTFLSTITAPASATAGTLVRLRIVAMETQEAGSVQPCGSYGNGETQEYLLRVIPAQTDVTAVAYVEGTSSFCANTQMVSVRVRNNGGTDQRNVPVTLQVINTARQPVASLTSSVSLLRAYHDALVTFDLPASVLLAIGETYQLVSTILLASDQDTTNNRLVASRTIAGGTVTGTFTAASCGGDPTVVLRNTGNSTALWYDSPTSGTLLAAGNQTSAPTRPVYYVTTNDFAGRLGPVAKTDFQGGSYAGNFGPQPLISTKVPMRIERARIYTGAAGRLTFQVRKYDETVISSTTIDVVATRTLPASQTNANGQQSDDPNDVGAVYPLNLSIPEPGDYKISIEYEEGVTIFRSNSVTAGSGSSFAFPYALRAQNGDVLASTKGSLFDTGTSIDTLRAAWYYFYDMQIRPLECPATQRTAVNVTTRPSPTAAIAAVTNTTACQGALIVLRSASSTAVAGDALTYQWLLNGQAITNATSESFAAGASGQYALRIAGSCAPVTSSAVSISIVQPELPVISQSGLVLTSNAPGRALWLQNGVPISGATGQTYTVTQTGRYSVEASVNGCGVAISDELYVAILAVEPAIQASLRVYPNPTQNRLTVEVAAPATGPEPTVRLYDARGILQQQQTMSRLLSVCSATFDLATLPAGTFFVQVMTDTTQTAAVKAVLKY